MYIQNLILGGGITGLSTAYHLELQGRTDYLVVEKEAFLGGLCASQTVQGFTFDQSGHLLHLHHPYTTNLVKKLLRGNLQKIQRKAWIYTDTSRVPFPFQANLFALPEPIRCSCLVGARHAAAQTANPPKHFKDWCLQAFGPGIYQYFLKPYNQKLWQTAPEELTADWCSPFVPKPDLAQIEQGAQKQTRQPLGYNAVFYYPKRGGCGALTDALAARVPNTWLNATVQAIDLKHKTVQINGQTVTYKNLINTLPLNIFLELTGCAALRVLSAKLAHTTVHVFNFAINRSVTPFSWIYLPDRQDLCYRVGLQSGFAVGNAPQKTSSFYVETAGPITDFKKAETQIFQTLQQKGIIEKKDKILLSFWQTIPVAYAIYNKNRLKTVQKALEPLERSGIFCAGRYGLWEYSFMERCILQGRETAEKLV